MKDKLNRNNFSEIFTQIIANKNMIFIITLACVLINSLFVYQKDTLFKSSALIEIGFYDQIFKQNPIDDTMALVEDLVLYFNYKQNELEIDNENYRIRGRNDKLVEVFYISPDYEVSEQIVNKIVSYAESSHKQISDQKISHEKNSLINELNQLNKKITFQNDKSFQTINYLTLSKSYNKNKLEKENEIKKSDTENIIKANKNKLASLEQEVILINSLLTKQSELLSFDLENFSGSSIDFEDTILSRDQFIFTQKKKLIENKKEITLLKESNLIQIELLSLLKKEDSLIIENIRINLQIVDNQSNEATFDLNQRKDEIELLLLEIEKNEPIPTQSIGGVVTIKIKKNMVKNIFLSLIFGLLFSILVTFFIAYIKDLFK
tara:strand:- start:707 stop:1840 length:1134 start_codon:yes stop_codon:yes gene_type:complete